MKKLKVYLDTSVIGAIFDVEDTERVRVTESLLDKIKHGEYEGYTSNITLAEINKGPTKLKEHLTQKVRDTKLKILDEDEECVYLADEYLKEKIIPKTYRDDARHIGIAVKNQMDVVVSWNYRHMVNLSVRRCVNSVNLRLGYKTIEIVSPMEVVGYE